MIVPYTTADGRRQLLDTIGGAVEHLAASLASLTEAYEMLDESSGDRLEQQLFRPVGTAYGQLKRAHGEFAERHGLSVGAFADPVPGAPSLGARGFIDSAVAAIASADRELGTLQDSMLPVEVGDATLRHDLEQVRERLGGLGGRARELERTLGR